MSEEREICLVFMPDEKNCNMVFDYGVRVAADELELECVRTTELGLGDQIGNIISLLYKAKIIVVDVSDVTFETLYELGIAHGLLQNVIMITYNKYPKIPLDLISYKVIDYSVIESDPSKGYKKASGHIKQKIIECVKTMDQWRENSNPVFKHLERHQRPVHVSVYNAEREARIKADREVERLMEVERANVETQTESSQIKSQLEAKEIELRSKTAELEKMNAKYEKMQRDLEVYEKNYNEYKKLKDEMQKLKDENNHLQGAKEFSEAFLNKLLGDKVKGMSLDEIFNMFQREMDEKGEFKVDIPGKKKNLKFRKLKENEKVDLK